MLVGKAKGVILNQKVLLLVQIALFMLLETPVLNFMTVKQTILKDLQFLV